MDVSKCFGSVGLHCSLVGDDSGIARTGAGNWSIKMTFLSWFANVNVQSEII